MNTRVYRLLIVASFACLGLAIAVDALRSNSLPPELQAYLSFAPRQPTGAGIVVGFIYLGGVLASAIGLYRLRSWARPVALTLTLMTFAAELLLGPRVQ